MGRVCFMNGRDENILTGQSEISWETGEEGKIIL
jgi:hypothetical protein